MYYKITTKEWDEIEQFKENEMKTTTTNKIEFRTLFSGIRNINYDEALSIAKYRFKNITMGKTLEDTVAIVNRRFSGIKFSLKDLKQGEITCKT